LAEAVAELKRRPGRELQVHGSGALVNNLARHDLVDEYRLLIFPVLLGTGKRLFAEGSAPTAFQLTGSTTNSTGVTVPTYERAGGQAGNRPGGGLTPGVVLAALWYSAVLRHRFRAGRPGTNRAVAEAG